MYIHKYIYMYIEFTAFALGVQACPFPTRGGGQGTPVKGVRKPKNSVKANLKEV